jgi:hypothetical protein
MSCSIIESGTGNQERRRVTLFYLVKEKIRKKGNKTISVTNEKRVKIKMKPIK